MSSPLYVEISDKDNVATAVNDIPAGTLVMDGARVRQDISQAHKMALCDIPEGDKIIRYSVVLGYAINSTGKGQWVNEKMPGLPTPSSVDGVKFTTNLVTGLPKPPMDVWEGYINPNGGYAGTRNILGVSTTVQYVIGVLNAAVARMKSELFPKYPSADDIVPINHTYGCGVAISAPETKISIRTLRSLVKHPNLDGELMTVGLDCKKFTVEMLPGQADISLDNVIMLQEKRDFDDMVNPLIEVMGRKLDRPDRRRCQTLPLSELLIGMQCEGSGAFSGVTANPGAGYVVDMLVKGGATILFSEVTEVRDGMYLPGERCVNEEVGEKLAAEMKWYGHYLENGQVDHSASPTPDSKRSGLSNIVKRVMGSTVKSDTSPVVKVLSPAEKPSRKGPIYTVTSTSGIVCGSRQLIDGIGLQVSMAGRGAPYDLTIVPIIEVCSRDDMKMQQQDLTDVNAGPIAIGDTTVQGIRTQLFHGVVDVASDRKQSYTGRYKLHNDLCIFNPAPIAW